MVNTYNESNLHLTLKKLYALETNGRTEIQIEGTKWIADIIEENGNIIEIQTANLSALTEKVRFLLDSGRKVKIVHPIVFEKWIETLEINGDLKSRRKSPKRNTIYSVLRGLTKIYPLLENKNLTVEILYVNVTEIRRKTEEKVQLLNKSRRHLKDWIPEGKRLEKILKVQRFCGLEDWKKIFPVEENAEFSKKELYSSIYNSDFLISDLISEKFSDSNRKDAAKWSSVLLWLGKNMNFIEETGKKGRSLIFRMK